MDADRHGWITRSGSDIAAFDLFGQLLDQIGDVLQMRMHRDGATSRKWLTESYQQRQ